MRIFTDLGRKYTLREVNGFLEAIATVNWDYLCLLDEHCDLAFKILTLATPSLVPSAMPPMRLPYTFVLPKTDAGFLAVSQQWHEVMSPFFPRRDYKLTQEQQEALRVGRLNLKTPLIITEDEWVGSDEECLEALNLAYGRNQLEERLNFQLLTEAISRLAPAAAERDYFYPFERWRPSPAVLAPRLLIDLKPATWFLQQSWDSTIYVAYLRRGQLRIKHTKRLQKHATKRLGIGFKSISALYVFVNGMVTAFDEQTRVIPSLHGAKQTIVKCLSAFDLTKTKFFFVYDPDRLIPLTAAQFTLACSTDWEPGS